MVNKMFCKDCKQISVNPLIDHKNNRIYCVYCKAWKKIDKKIDMPYGARKVDYGI